MTAIVAKDLKKNYGQHLAVQGVSFEISDRQVDGL